MYPFITITLRDTVMLSGCYNCEIIRVKFDLGKGTSHVRSQVIRILATSDAIESYLFHPQQSAEKNTRGLKPSSLTFGHYVPIKYYMDEVALAFQALMIFGLHQGNCTHQVFEL
jgi:hypothetical protein